MANNVREAEALAQAWEKLVKIAILGFLFLSALISVLSAFMIGYFYVGEDANLVQSLLFLFGGVAFAVGLAFRKLLRPTWKQWLAIAVLAAPGALYTFFR